MEGEVPISEKENNIIDLKEDNEDPNARLKNNQTPTRHLRNIKQVNYATFFSEDADNSEDYEPDEESQKKEITKKRQRPKSAVKSKPNDATGAKNEEKGPEKNQMEIEENNVNINNNDKKIKNSNTNTYGTIINIAQTLNLYSNTNNDNNNEKKNTPNNTNIPNSELILIILEICLNSSQFGIEKDNSSRAFWDEVGKVELLKPITSKFKTETLRKYWRTIRETKKYRKIISETKRYRAELNDNNLKLLSSIKAICEYVSSQSKRKFEYYLNKHKVNSSNKPKKISVNDMTPSEQIADVVNTFKVCFPKKKEKDIIEALLQTSFDIENAFLVLKDKENLGFLSFSEKDDEIVKKNYEDNDDKNEEYQELINIKGLEEVIRRKEFLFNVIIDRSQYNKIEEDENEKKENELEIVNIDDGDGKKENEKGEEKIAEGGGKEDNKDIDKIKEGIGKEKDVIIDETKKL